MNNFSLDEAAIFLPLLDEAENHTTIVEAVGLPVLFGVLFLPGLALGIFLPKGLGLALIAIILLLIVFFVLVLAKESRDPLKKKIHSTGKRCGRK